MQQIVFSFYNDQLFRLVIDYDPDRAEGMADADMIEAISSAYGSPGQSTVEAEVLSAVIANDERTRDAARVLETDSAAGV